MKETEMSVPHLFRCPISLDLFQDPVTLCTGQSYERSNILKWLAAGNLTCPVTMQKLHDPTIIPNHTLRHLIDQWLKMGPGFDLQYLVAIDSLASLKHDLESNGGSLDAKQRALEKLDAQFQESSPSRTPCLVQLGFFPLLLSSLFQKATSEFTQEYIKFVETALSCVLRLLPVGELGPMNLLKEDSRMESFTCLFKSGTIVIKTRLCHIVGVTSSSSETIKLCAKFGENIKLLQEIISLLHHNSEASHAAIRAISSLCSLESNRGKLVRQGAIYGLVSYIKNTEKCDVSVLSFAPIAVARIEQLLGHEGGKEALADCPDGIKALVKMVFRVSDHEGSENAINALMISCCNSLCAQEDAIESGILSQLLLLLQSQCSGRTKSKARMLLKLLRSKRK